MRGCLVLQSALSDVDLSRDDGQTFEFTSQICHQNFIVYFPKFVFTIPILIYISF